MNEGGQILILPSKLEEAGGLSSLIQGLSSTHKDTPSTQDSQDNKHENKETSSEDTVGGSPVALAYLLEGGVGSILNAGYFLHGVAAAYPPITNDIERIRASHGGLLGLPPLEFVENHHEVVEEIEKIILETYGQKGVEIYHKLCQNASGFYPRQGFEVGREIETLEAKPEANDQQTEKGERTNAPAKDGIEKDKEKVGTNKQDNRTDNSVKEWENSFLLSQETDQNNSPFILSSSGSIDFGQISARHNLPSAPVRLSLGDAENGYRHINRRHGQQIKDNGFNSIQEFVEYVLSNFTRIVEGEAYKNESGGKNQTYLVQLQDKHNNTLYIQLSRDGKYWNISSAGVFGKNYGNKKKEIWSASEVQNDNSAIVSDGLQSEPNADNSSISNGTPSKSSTHKDTPSTPNSQAEEVKNEEAQPKSKTKKVTGKKQEPKAKEPQTTQTIPEAILGNTKSVVTAAVNKVNVADFTAEKGFPRTALHAVHRANGFVEATSGYILVRYRENYDKKYEKTYLFVHNAEDGTKYSEGGIKYFKAGELVPDDAVRFPNTENWMTSRKKGQYEEVNIPIDEMIIIAKAALNLSKVFNEIYKDIPCCFEINGKKVYFQAGDLLKAASMAKKLGFNEVILGRNKTLQFTPEKELDGQAVLCAPFPSFSDRDPKTITHFGKDGYINQDGFYEVKTKIPTSVSAAEKVVTILTALANANPDIRESYTNGDGSIKTFSQLHLWSEVEKKLSDKGTELAEQIGSMKCLDESQLEKPKPKSGTKKSVPKNEENAPKTKKSLRQHKAEQAQAATTEDTARRDALTDLMQQSGMEVFVDEKAQQVLDEVNGRGAQVRLQAKLSALSKAAKLIHNWIANKVQGRIFTIELPEATRRMIRNVMGRDFDSHNITINGIRHGLKNHGVEGKKLNANSVPIREEDAELIPYIMTAPDYVRKGSEDVTGRESIRFYKTLSNGFVVVVEKEYKNSPNDMETINIWAEMSSEATNAQRRAVPDTNVQNAILSTDAAKIRKDAEDAIRKEEKLREHRVFHGSGAEFDAFDHSHMGEGEGAQAYGWGTYVTEVEGIGRAYARNPWQMKINELESNISRAKEKLPFMPPSDTKTELENNIKEWEEELAKLENGNRHLYTVEIPDDNGENYLHWEKPLTREQIVRITEKLKSGGWNVVDGNHPTFEKNGERIVLNERAQGQDVYTELEEAFGSDKAASEFLASIGFTGISYPAEYRSGGRNDGARNFVIFNESDAQITDHIRFFRTPGGEAYGFTVNGKIYLDPRIATAETAIHEYAHLWADMLRQMNPEAWNDIVQLMKGTSVWDEVKSLYPELKTEDEIADEVLAHYSGRRGAAKLSKEQHRIAHDQNMDLRSKATAIAALERIKQALTKFWKGVADLLHIRFTTAEEVADRILADLLHGVNPTAYAKREDGKVRKQLIGEKGAAAIDKDEQATARLDNPNTPESTDIDHILGNGNSKQGEKVRQHMETIAQKLGLKLNWVSSNKQSNGFYDPQTKTITIAADAENPLAAVFGHETVHRLKEMNVEAFNSLVALAKEILGSSFDAEVAKIESRYRKAGMNYDTAYYEEEAVCDFVGDMIDNQNLLERICWDANHKVLSALRNIFDKILAAIGIKDARLMHIRTVISAAYEQSVRNDESSKLTTGNEVKRDSLKRKDEVDEKSSGYFKKHPDAMSESVFAQAQKDMDDIAEWMNPYYDATAMGNRLLPEEQYGRKGAASTIFANGSYGKTMENTLKCIRTLAYNQFTDDVKKQLGRPLTQKESFLASQMVYDIATDPQCLYCYVSLDRKAYDDFLLKYVQQKEDILDKFRGLSQEEKSAAAKGAPHTALKELYAEFLAKRKDTKNMQARFNMWIRNEMAGNRSVKASDLITAETRRAILDGLDTSLAREVRDAEKYAQGASWAKKDVDYISYIGELLKLSPAWIKKLTGEYGLRFYSFSEYTPAFILENMQMVRDASLRGLNGLGYTKELDFVKIFAPTGMNINCSVYGRMDNEGNMHMDTLQGADWEEVKQLRSKYNNVGAVFVATNDASVDWALNQDWIDVIIPFHIVRTGADIAEFYGWDNHMRDQSDHFADSSKTMYVSPVEHQNDKEKFLEACKKHGLIPRFEKWMNHPNYMRLVNETRLSVNETRPIKPIFDMTEAKDSWDRFVNRGGYYNGWWQVSPEEYANNVRTVVEDIRSGKMANEVEYGRQDMPANPERMIAAARKKRIHGNVPLVDVFDRSGNVLGRKAESSNGAVLYREGENQEEKAITQLIKKINDSKDNKSKQEALYQLGEAVKDFSESLGYPTPNIIHTREELINSFPESERSKVASELNSGYKYGGFLEKGEVFIYIGEPSTVEIFAKVIHHEYIHRFNQENPEYVEMLKASVSDFKDVSRMELEEILQDASNSNKYSENAKKMEERGKNALSMLADETLAHVLQNNLDSSQNLQSPYTDNQTILFIANKLKSSINEERGRSIYNDYIRRETTSYNRSQKNGTENVGNRKGQPGDGRLGRTEQGLRDSQGRRSGEEQAGGIASITQAANRTAGSLHLDNVTILGEQDLASLTPKQRSAKGWFDPKTGRIYINASNHANEADVVQTVLHEAVAHYGLRALFGKDFDTMLDQGVPFSRQ